MGNFYNFPGVDSLFICHFIFIHFTGLLIIIILRHYFGRPNFPFGLQELALLFRSVNFVVSFCFEWRSWWPLIRGYFPTAVTCQIHFRIAPTRMLHLFSRRSWVVAHKYIERPEVTVRTYTLQYTRIKRSQCIWEHISFVDGAAMTKHTHFSVHHNQSNANEYNCAISFSPTRTFAVCCSTWWDEFVICLHTDERHTQQATK